MPDWIGTALAVFAALAGVLGLNEWIKSWRKSKMPTPEEKQEQRFKNMEFQKLYSDASYAHMQLTEYVDRLVEEKTESLRNILIDRELEHKKQVDYYIQRLSEKEAQIIKFQKHLSDAEKEIAELKDRVNQLENNNNH